MGWREYAQLAIAVGVGAGLAWLTGNKSLLEMLAGGIIAAVLHAIPLNALSQAAGKGE